MKKKTVIFATAVLAVALTGLTACGKNGGDHDVNDCPAYGGPSDDFTFAPGSEAGAGGDSYVHGSVIETGFTNVTDGASSYFSLDRNTAGYSFVRMQLERGAYISGDSVRVEELINYFDYSYPRPETQSIGVSAYLSDCPWNEESKLVTVGVTTRDESVNATNGNYVFLVDVSGSMSGDDRLGLAKYGFNTLLNNLGGGDVVSIVKYASGTEVVADGIECTEDGKKSAKNTMDGLSAYGSTNGKGGLELAYETAQKHFITGGNNRIIIISDGDFNVGNTSLDYMKEFIQEKAKGGTYLSVIGVGMGNTRDDMLETLAKCGNGNYAYLDNKTEAEKVFTHDLNGTLKTVAKDAKAGVTFTENVVNYRLIGYDTKHISEDEFNNDKTDAGELGSGLCATAVYEITLKPNADGEIATAEVRYKDALNGEKSESVSATVTTTSLEYSADADFAACVAEFGLVLRNSKYAPKASLNNVYDRLGLLSDYIGADPYKTEFVSLVQTAIRSEKYGTTGNTAKI